ncbi:MAG: mechanosensitive ion channel family protein [Labilithrix sp.]|nr:mechanosensitive ion channel family protein [Labilithrix sp.]
MWVRRLFLLVLIAVVTLAAAPAYAQTTRASASAGDPPPAEEEVDSPRASMRSFFDLCDRGRYQDAARYLDVPRGSEKRAAELADKLHVVLGERLWVNPENLSPLSQGKKGDALPPGTEELGRIVDAKGHTIHVRIVRHESRSPEDEPRWVFSQSTVQAVDGLYASLKGRWVRDRLPAPLLGVGPRGLYYWQWAALPLLAMICAVIGRLLTPLSGKIATLVFKKVAWAPRLLPRLRKPVTMAWTLIAFWLLLPYLALTLRAEDLLARLLRALGWLAFFWALFRTVTIVGDEMGRASWARARPNMRAVTGVGVRFGKFVVAALALMVALSELGYPVTTVVAGLGLGGVALALAAQKTVENLFGSVSILADQPFRVGDMIRVDGIEATVETIGLRSTRMRTVERTLVIIPNGKLADMRIESVGSRDKIRFSARLALSRETTPAQIEAIIGAIRSKLEAHAKVSKPDVFVRLTALGESSFDVDVAAPIETVDGKEFALIREELLLDCMRSVDASGAKLAIPARRIVRGEGSA